MFYSPLRYPGGKGKLEPFIELLIKQTGHLGGTYIEPFAGGAGIAIELLEKGIVSRVVLNDYDKGIYSFWKAILTETERFVNDIRDAKLNIEEWKRQKAIAEKNKCYSYELGFATFYLNRTNRSGIIKGGVIGGLEQKGQWRMDARFNKDTLIKRIERIANMKNKIALYNKDVNVFVKKYLPKYSQNAFVYFDPPYYEKGSQLYMNYFSHEDHVRIKETIKENVESDWIITYDDVKEIENIYTDSIIRKFDLNYSVASKRRASEILVFKNKEMIPYDSLLEENNISINMRGSSCVQ